MKLLLAENLADGRHIELEQQRQQGDLLAGCDDLAHYGYINGAQEERRFIQEVRCSAEVYAFPPLDKDIEAGLVRSGIAGTWCGASVERQTGYRGCMFPCRVSVGGNFAGQFSPQLNDL